MRKLKTQMAIGQAQLSDLPADAQGWIDLLNPQGAALSPTGAAAYIITVPADPSIDGSVGVVLTGGAQTNPIVTLNRPNYEGLGIASQTVIWASV
jgi:hypothetical protein